MPSITIRDALNAEIITADPQVTTGLGKYLTGAASQLLAGVDVAGQLRTPLHLADAGESGLSLSWSKPVPLGGDKVALRIEAGARAVVGVYNRTGMELLENTFIGEPLEVPAGTAFVSFSIHPTLALGLKRKVGALSLGFSAGTEMDLRYYHPFDLTGDSMTLASACKSVLEHMVIPNTAADLAQMKDLPSGALSCASGHGELQISATVDLASAFNPLASVNTLPRLGKLEVGGGVTASVGVKATVSGDFQIRVEKRDGAVVRLSYHKVAGRGLDVTLGASLGASVTLGERDLLEMLFGGPGGLPGTSREDLVAAGISSKQLDRVTDAMEAGISRKLEATVGASFSSFGKDEAAFLYEIDLDRLDATGASAVDAALAGDLIALNELEPALPAHGLRVLQSRTQSIRKKKVSWRINLVGIVNVLSMKELVRTGAVFHDNESGELVITDKITNDHVGAVTTSRQIRKLLYESTVMSLTYKAVGLDVNTSFDIAQSFFFLDGDANRQRMSDYLDAVAAVGLIRASDIDAELGGEDDFGKSSLLLETTFNKAACERVFHPANRPPPDQNFYEAIGRQALLGLVKASDPDAYRRVPLQNDTLWKAMKAAGQANFRFILPPPITGGNENRQAVQVGVVAADYSVIVWWSSAMALAAGRFAEMQTFLNGRNPAALDTDPAFRKRRRDLETAMVKAIRSNTSTFDDPWGLVALHLASAGAAGAAATIVSPKLTLFLPE